MAKTFHLTSFKSIFLKSHATLLDFGPIMSMYSNVELADQQENVVNNDQVITKFLLDKNKIDIRVHELFSQNVIVFILLQGRNIQFRSK